VPVTGVSKSFCRTSHQQCYRECRVHNFPSYRSQAVQYGEPEGLPLADQPARHLPAFPVSQPAALPSASAEPSPIFYSRASQCQSCSGPSQQHACQRLCSDYASARHGYCHDIGNRYAYALSVAARCRHVGMSALLLRCYILRCYQLPWLAAAHLLAHLSARPLSAAAHATNHRCDHVCACLLQHEAPGRIQALPPIVRGRSRHQLLMQLPPACLEWLVW
jgi:hypothetical protein